MTKTKNFVIRATLFSLVVLICLAAYFYINKKEEKMQKAKPTIILSLDGGGVHGIVSVKILQEIEKRLGKRVHEIFDVMVGTSIGSLEVAALNKPKGNSKEPDISTEDLLVIFKTFGEESLSIPLKHRIATINGLIGPLFSKKEYIKSLKKIFGDFKLNESLKAVIIPALNLKNDNIVIFNSKNNSSNENIVTNIISGSTAVPNFFQPEMILVNGKEEEIADPWVVLNDPALLGLIQSHEMHPNSDRIIISVGCGRYPINNNRGGQGLTSFVSNTQDILHSGGSNKISEYMESFIKYNVFNLKKYYRLDPVYSNENGIKSSLDSSEEAINALIKTAEEYIIKNSKQIDAVVTTLRVYMAKRDKVQKE